MCSSLDITGMAIYSYYFLRIGPYGRSHIKTRNYTGKNPDVVSHQDGGWQGGGEDEPGAVAPDHVDQLVRGGDVASHVAKRFAWGNQRCQMKRLIFDKLFC